MRGELIVSGAFVCALVIGASATRGGDELPARREAKPVARGAPDLARTDARPAQQRVLRAPGLGRWEPEYSGLSSAPPAAAGGEALVAVAGELYAPVFSSTRSAAHHGRLFLGRTLPAQALAGKRCHTGRSWYAVDGGFVCDGDGLRVGPSSKVPRVETLDPDTTAPLPFEYLKVMTDGAPRLSRLPTREELAQVDAGEDPPGLVAERMSGAFFLAEHRTASVGDRELMRTVTGEYVELAHMKRWPDPQMIGVHLDEEHALPVAFVHGADGAQLYCVEDADARPDGPPVPCGAADKHARFVVDRVVGEGADAWVVARDGTALARRDVRLATRRAPPEAALAERKWVHIDLSEQTLTAYEGEEPVFTTMISSGKGRHATPTGLYNTQRKYMSRTMVGPDPDVGKYHIEQVPWVLYYHRGYAVHGAYWHDTFGNVRSHGCTNVPPADARWLYYWSELEVPAGWHGVVGGSGTRLWFTRDGKAG